MSKAREPWEQKKGEPATAFAKFTVYLNLGPGRSARAAAAVGNRAKPRPSGQWVKLCSQWDWVNRASEWDRHNVSTHGEEVVLIFVATLRKLANRALKAINKKDMGPKGCSDILEIVKVLSQYVTVDAVQKVQQPHAVAGPKLKCG